MNQNELAEILAMYSFLSIFASRLRREVVQVIVL